MSLRIDVATPASVPMLISMSGIAGLARVQRPVVSMWRRRFASAPDPFPAPVANTTNGMRFAAAEVAEWLLRTGHGANPDAAIDAAAFADLGVDLGNDGAFELASALLTIRAITATPLGDPDDIRVLAIDLDPDDLVFRAEVTEASNAALTTAIGVIETLAEAAFGNRGALRVLDARLARSQASSGADGDLAPEAIALIADLTSALGTTGVSASHPILTVGAGGPLATNLVASIAEAITADGIEPQVMVPSIATPARRALLRRLLVAGHLTAGPLSADQLSTGGAIDTAPPGGVGVSLSRLSEQRPLEQLAALESAVLDAPASMSMVVVGPASVLTDAATRPVRDTRAQILRTGRVRGIVRLSAGLVPSAPRHALALWVLAPPHADLPIIDRLAVLADLDGVTLSAAVRGDLVSDLAASVGSPREVRAHAFRFARFSRTASLLASGGSLVAATHDGVMPRGTGADRQARTVPRTADAAAAIPALIDRQLAALGDAPRLPSLAVEATGAAARATVTTLGALVDDGDARVLPGTRIRPDQFDADGFRVIGADLDAAAPRFIDRVRFALEFGSARLTEPGDVVFVGGARPRAIVDAEGAKIVASPARVLRLADRAFVPEVVAAEISALGIRLPWRRWPVRRVPLAQAATLRTAIAAIAAERAQARHRITALDELEALVTTGVAVGAITLTSATPAAPTKGTP